MKRSLAFVYLVLLAITAFSQTTKNHEYDAAGRLTRTTYSNGVQIFYTYDALGNRTSKTVINGCPEGATSGIFSVGSNKYAYFSQGNLQYQASTNTWRFAEHQWDYVGYNDDGNVYENGIKCDNSLASETYEGWIDFFGWGTSGYNHGANCYQPWANSSNNQDYLAYGVEGLSLYEGDTEHRGQADWGYNPIANGGNEENCGWRTPTAAEWDYLLNTRTTSSGIRFAYSVVNDMAGMILLPDDWDASVYALNNPNKSFISTLEFENADDFEAFCNSNTIDAQTWTEVLEPSGAVFIPYTFYSLYGGYWTSSSAGCLSSGSSPSPFWVVLSEVATRYFWTMCQVRLINNVVNHYKVSVSCGRAGVGQVIGGGSFAYGDLCTVEAEAVEGYAFAHWTENGVVVSTDASYTFEVYTNHNLVAQFKDIQNDDPDLLEGRFSIGDDRVARFAKGNLNLAFDFNATGQANVEWSFAEHQWHRKYFNADAFVANVENYLENNGLDFLYHRFLHDVNYDIFVVDLGCWTTLSDEEWEYLLHQRITASGMHYAFCQVDNVYGIVLFPDDWEAPTYPLPNNVIDEEMTSSRSIVFKYISINDWNAYFEPSHAVFLPLVFRGLYADNLNDDDMGGAYGPYAFNYSHFICGNRYLDEYDQWHDGVCVHTPSENIAFEAASIDGYSEANHAFGYERLVQIETRNYEVIGAQPNPLWAGEVNGGGIFENQMRDGETCTLTATAKSGHSFLGWYENGRLISTETSLAFVVEGSRFIEAYYSADVDYQVYAEALPQDGGYVNGAGQFEEWQECQLEAEPRNHYHFVGWMEGDSIVSTSRNYTFPVTSERHLQACFAMNQSYLLTANAVPEEGGMVFPSTTMSFANGSSFSEEFEEMSMVSVIASANDGYHFVGWKVGDEWVSMDNFYSFSFPSNDLAVEAYFEPCEVESEPDPDLLSGRFSISGCTTVGFAKGNVICQIELGQGSIAPSWSIAPFQYYRQSYDNNSSLDATTLSSMMQDGMDLVYNIFEHAGVLDFDCWHLLSTKEWDYLLKEREIEVRYAFAKVNNVEGLLVMPDDWDPATYTINSPNEAVAYATNSISRYDWNTVLQPAGVLFLPANGTIWQDGQGYLNGIHQGDDVEGSYLNLVFIPEIGVSTEENAFMMPMAFTSMRLAQILETATTNVVLSVGASQTDFGTVSGGGEFNCGSSCTVTANPNNGYVFRYWLEEGEVVSTEAEYTFPVTTDRNLVAEFIEENEACEVELQLFYDQSYAQIGWLHDSVVLNFGDDQPEVRYTVPVPQIDWYEIYLSHGNTNVSFAEMGLPDYLSYSLYVNKGDAVMVSFEQSDNSLNMTRDFVLAFADADTIVEGNAAEVLPFTFVGNCDLFASHTKTLDNGWNWWSTYIEQEDADGLTMLERSLGSKGIMIKSRSDGYVESYEYEGTIGWFGPLASIKNEQMYKIDMNADGRAVMRGLRTETSSHPITINYGWNWIGFPMSQSVAVSQAMSGFSPEPNDVLKGRNGFTTYYSNNGELGWYGTLNTLEPGSGYMYQSQSNGIKTLVFQEGRGHATEANITPEGNVYRPNGGRYADNMTVTAVVEVNGEELRSDTYELAAFSGDECRGSVRLMYVEPVDRYVAFLTVFGEQGDDIGFRLTDGTKTLQSPDRIVFVADGISGTLSNPTLLRFGDTGIGEQSTMVRIHPNPVDRDARFTISLPLDEDIEEVIVTNALGAVVRHETGALKSVMEGLSTSGVYMVKATCRSGNVYVGRLVVK